MQPIIYLVLFGPLVKGIAPSLAPGAGKILTPALVIQIGLFGALFVGFGTGRLFAAGEKLLT